MKGESTTYKYQQNLLTVKIREMILQTHISKPSVVTFAQEEDGRMLQGTLQSSLSYKTLFTPIISDNSVCTELRIKWSPKSNLLFDHICTNKIRRIPSDFSNPPRIWISIFVVNRIEEPKTKITDKMRCRKIARILLFL